MLKDSGEKLSAADRAPVDSAIADLKAAIEKNDVAEMKRTMEALNAAQHKVAEVLYRSASAGAGGGQAGGPEAGAGGPSAGGNTSDDVIDAEVVEEEKK
jgi:molecular chaperone DnaK